MKDQIADLRICIRRIQDHLAKEEVFVSAIVNSSKDADDKTNPWAVRINK